MDLPIQSKRILVVEDNPEMRQSVANTLRLERYQVDQADNGQAALTLLQRVTPDLILSDINMPRMGGIEFYRLVRQNPRWLLIPFIFLTAGDSPDEIRRGRSLGVEDYLTKPIESADLISAVNARLLRVAQVEVAQIGRSYLETVNVLANTIEGRDAYTHGHVERVAEYARALAGSLGWAPEHLRMLEFGARLHDIGKIVIPDTILNKPNALTPSEWEAMKQHPAAGARILREISHLQSTLPYVLYHHERWDGSGYPHALKGKDIPVEGRLLAIADVYDALTTARPYHPARTHYEVIQFLEKSSGRLFDPHLVPMLLRPLIPAGPTQPDGALAHRPASQHANNRQHADTWRTEANAVSDTNIVDVSEATFSSEVLAQSSRVPVVVDFWAPWCGPCRTLGPLLARLATEGKGAFVLAKVNVDDSPRLSAEYGVQGIPAVKAFRDGQVVDEFVGAQPEAKVREFLKKVAPTAADRKLAEANSLLATRHWAEAEAAFRAVLADQPASDVAALGLLKSLLALGRGCEADDLLADFPRGDAAPAAEKLTPLARVLCEVEGADAPLAENDLDAQYLQSARLVARGQLEAGMDGLLDVLRQDKRYRKGEPRQVLVALFELLGDDDLVTREYRGELASVLY